MTNAAGLMLSAINCSLAIPAEVVVELLTTFWIYALAESSDTYKLR